MARSSFVTTSPKAQESFDRLMMLSSSPLPDIRELGPRKPKSTILRSGSAAAPVPAGATKTFTSAADLLRREKACADGSEDFIDEPERPVPQERKAKPARKTTRASKRVAKEFIELSSDAVTPDGDSGDIHMGGMEGFRDDTAASPLEAKPWKIYKAPADLGEKDKEKDKDLSAGAVEPQAKAKTKVQRKKKIENETVSRHFAKKDGPTGSKTTKPAPQSINLEMAVQRRRDWTPPREDTRPGTLLTPTAASNANQEHISPCLSQTEVENGRDNIFRNLHEAYALEDTGQKEYAANNAQPVSLGKRKATDMVSGGQSSKQAPRRVSPTKTKAPKKKPRTITELATAAYAPKPTDLHEDTPTEGDSILEYFDVDRNGNVSKMTTGNARGKSTKVTKKKPPPKQPVLLSPKAAMRQSARQDFVFGTSSQLIRGESPTFLRDLQAALRLSNIITEEDCQSVDDLPRPRNLALKSMKHGGGLWSVSARDEDGEVVNVEVIDLVGSPFPEDDAVAILDPWKDLPPELPAASGTEAETAEPSLIEIESMPVATSNTSSQLPVPASNFLPTQPKVTIKAAAAAAATVSPDSLINDAYPLITDLLQECDAPPPSNQEQSQEETRQISPAMPRKIQKTRPNYELFTDAKLAKEVSSFGFKPVKSRTGMLALLDQCWESRSRAPIGVASFSTSASSSNPKGKKEIPAAAPVKPTSPPPKKPQARTKKVADAAGDGSAVAVGRQSSMTPAKRRSQPRKDALATAGPATTAIMPPPPKAQPAISTPKRRKATTQTRAEIADSDLDSDGSDGVSSPAKIFTSPGGGAVDMSVNEDTELTLDLSPTAQESELFSHITRAVTSAPRTTDPENPSWHEKMLMYDPIILEDLAAWLNSGQLTRVGYDGEA
jgi:hypothetical protein